MFRLRAVRSAVPAGFAQLGVGHHGLARNTCSPAMAPIGGAATPSMIASTAVVSNMARRSFATTTTTLCREVTTVAQSSTTASGFMSDWTDEKTKSLLESAGLKGKPLEKCLRDLVPSLRYLRKLCRPGDFTEVRSAVQEITEDETMAKAVEAAFLKEFPPDCEKFLGVEQFPVQLREWDPTGNDSKTTESCYERIRNCNTNSKHVQFAESEASETDDQKVVVVCGESGVGKSHWSLTQGDEDTLTVYCRVGGDISKEDMDKYKKYPDQFCAFMFKEKGLLDRLWERTKVNLVLDEIGAYPNLLSTVCRNGASLRRWAKEKTVALRIFCVGTGAESLNSAPGSDPRTYRIKLLGQENSGPSIFEAFFGKGGLGAVLSVTNAEAGQALGQRYPIFKDLASNFRLCWLLVKCLQQDLKSLAEKKTPSDKASDKAHSEILEKFVEQSAASLLLRATFKFKGLNGLEALSPSETDKWCRYAVRLCCRTDTCEDVDFLNRRTVMTNLGLVNDNAKLVQKAEIAKTKGSYVQLGSDVNEHGAKLILPKGSRRYTMSAANSLIVATLLNEVPVVMSNRSGGPMEDFVLSKVMILLKSMKTNKELIEAFGLKFQGEEVTDLPSEIVFYRSPHQIAPEKGDAPRLQQSCLPDLEEIEKEVKAGKMVLFLSGAGASANDGRVLATGINAHFQIKDILGSSTLDVASERKKIMRSVVANRFKRITGTSKVRGKKEMMPYIVFFSSSDSPKILNDGDQPFEEQSEEKDATSERVVAKAKKDPNKLDSWERLITTRTGPFLCPDSWPLRRSEELVKKKYSLEKGVSEDSSSSPPA